MSRVVALFWLVLASLLAAANGAAADVRVKDLGRFDGWRESSLVGYGVVTGLTGTGDSPRNAVTRQALTNVLGRMGANISPAQIQSRNVATVVVTATLPPSTHAGDRIDVNVTSIGDARSLVGGTLLMTPLMGPDQRAYALAQGPLAVGGYRFNSERSVEQRNSPTAAVVSRGATVETGVSPDMFAEAGTVTFLLREADFTTATRVADAVNAEFGQAVAQVADAGAIRIDTRSTPDIFRLITRIEAVRVDPDEMARIVVNERTGTIVAGGGVRISSVVISQGDIRVSVSVDNAASQPGYGYGAPSLIVSNTRLDVSTDRDAVISLPNTTVADLVQGLDRVDVDTRGKIAVLQAMQAAGALHADIVIQ